MGGVRCACITTHFVMSSCIPPQLMAKIRGLVSIFRPHSCGVPLESNRRGNWRVEAYCFALLLNLMHFGKRERGRHAGFSPAYHFVPPYSHPLVC